MKGQKYNWTLMSNLGRPISDIACPISDIRDGTCYVRDGTSKMGHAMSEMGRLRWDTYVQLYIWDCSKNMNKL